MHRRHRSSQIFPVYALLLLTAVATSAPLAASETRELGAHEHGVGLLNLAFEGEVIAIELEAPGADIVGFEHPAETAEDQAKIEAALAVLGKPLELFVFPQGAGCKVTDAQARLLTEDDHDAHDHDAHDHDDHAHDEHAHEEHEEAADEAHGDEHDDHSDHDDEGHDEESHAEEGHEEHHDQDDEASHTEFRAAYQLTCDNPGAANRIDFAYFSVFENARQLNIQMISDQGTAGHQG